MTIPRGIPSYLLDLLSQTRARTRAAEDELKEAREDTLAVERTILLFQAFGPGEVPELEARPPRYSPKDFAGLSQLNALIKMAEQNNGVVLVREAKRMLVETGLTKSKGSVSQIATGTMTRSKRFDWIAPGTYRLKPPTSDNHTGQQPSLIKKVE